MVKKFLLIPVPVLHVTTICSFILKAILFYSPFPSLVFNPADIPRGIKFIPVGLHFFCAKLCHFLLCPIIRKNCGSLLTGALVALPSLHWYCFKNYCTERQILVNILVLCSQCKWIFGRVCELRSGLQRRSNPKLDSLLWTRCQTWERLRGQSSSLEAE